MISPRFRLPRAHQAWRLTESLMNRTDPSDMATLTPPGWLLPGGMASGSEPQASPLGSFEATHWTLLGPTEWLYAPQIRQPLSLPATQLRPLPAGSAPPFDIWLPGTAMQARATDSASAALPVSTFTTMGITQP